MYKKEHIVGYRFLYTVIILLVYLVGKNIPLFMVDLSAYVYQVLDPETLLFQTISGDIYRCSIFALGIAPFMISNIIVQVISACISSDSKSKLSPVKMNKISAGIALVIAIVQAVLQTQKLVFRVSGEQLLWVQIIAGIQMVTGAFLIAWMSGRNKKYGIGGQSAIIFVNIVDGVTNTLRNADMEKLVLPLVMSAVVMFVILFMEETEVRIPVQRISIHNIYADKNYMAIKLNPIGVMPAMFSTAFFMLPQMIINLLLLIYPEHETLLEIQSKLSLNEPVGIALYLVILYVLTFVFSRVFINPKDVMEQYLKSGDSLVNIHAGDDTRKYLSKMITTISLLSATVMSICLVIPMLLQLAGHLDANFASLPSSVMMLTGIFCNLYREVIATKDLEAYKPFI